MFRQGGRIVRRANNVRALCTTLMQEPTPARWCCLALSTTLVLHLHELHKRLPLISSTFVCLVAHVIEKGYPCLARSTCCAQTAPRDGDQGQRCARGRLRGVCTWTALGRAMRKGRCGEGHRLVNPVWRRRLSVRQLHAVVGRLWGLCSWSGSLQRRAVECKTRCRQGVWSRRCFGIPKRGARGGRRG